MSDFDGNKEGKVTLDIELSDLIKIVSKSNSSPISGSPSQHSIEGEELRKAWFKHVLLSMEKMGDTIQTIRTTDLSDLRKELKAEIDKIDGRVTKNEDALTTYKKDIINPLSHKVTTLMVKLGVWGVVAGFIGSGLMALLIYVLKEYYFKAAP